MSGTNDQSALAGGGGETNDRDTTATSLYARYRQSPHTRPIQAVAFWLAVVLPFVHLSLLATGLTSRTATLVFVGLLVLNVIAVFAGHSYDPPEF